MNLRKRHKQLNKYRIMWLFVLFDLPVGTKKERKIASGFRKEIMKDGFAMVQFSVYSRHCASWQSAQVHIKRIKSLIPDHGLVSILQITDKQYADIINFWGKQRHSLSPTPQQLELF